MTIQQRLFDRVTLRVRNLEKSKAFYRAVLEIMGHSIQAENEASFSVNELLVTEDPEPTQCIFLSLEASNPGVVKLFQEAALKAGGRVKDLPVSDRIKNHFASTVLDPDGNAITAIYRKK